MFKSKLFIVSLLLIFILTILVSITVLSFNLFSSRERSSPSDWISEQQISVQKDKVILNILNPTWAKFTNTNSMDPFIDEHSNAIEIKPNSPEQINVGDVISYNSPYGIIIHRVIDINSDQTGLYYTVQGDNNTISDPVKV